ncbi:MAG: hypothetical protein QOF51_1123 [Chloroflexota bacterium]|jgi:hypothetical protein|nr:hypothetical protein [Chloroflexota bacterium]
MVGVISVVAATAGGVVLRQRVPSNVPAGPLAVAPRPAGAPLAPPLPALGRLSVVAALQGAVVFVDHAPRGETPIEVDAAVGARAIRIEADGYRPYETTVSVRANETTRLDLVLQREWPTTDPVQAVEPLAVVLDNQADARPQTGLDHADVVYEALAEGGITRFLALFGTQPAEAIGPVRSARDYFVNWAREYGAPLVHIGASPQAYATMRAAGIATLDETYGAAGFWRIASRPAPHNAYTSTAGARTALGSAGAKPGSFGGLHFTADVTRPAGSPATHAFIDFGRDDYWVDWDYDPATNMYGRGMNGLAHRDAATGEPLQAANVIVESVSSALIPGDDAGRLAFAQVGSGRFVALLDGVAIEGRWSKRDAGAPTVYQTADGSPLSLNAGPTWIEVIPPDGSLQI